MTKTFRPVFSAPVELDALDEADVDVEVVDDELELDDEHAASRTDTMTRLPVSQAVCLSFISESFQCEMRGTCRCGAGCWSRPASAIWVTAGYPPSGGSGTGQRPG